MGTIVYRIRPHLDPAALEQLFEQAWGTGKPGYEQVLERSFTWVAAMEVGRLVGFVNVAWDGGVHFFLLDTTVDPDCQRRGIGSRLIEEARRACAGPGRWLHVDADDDLMSSFYEPCGFLRTPAGLLSLDRQSGQPARAM
jgi:ribosomal protein S18 acetylase RimI-like enzyme